MSLVFKKIESRDIFTRDFSPLVRNNEIIFPQSEEIAVVYGPNGTGKTTLLRDIYKKESKFIAIDEEAKIGFLSQIHGEMLNENNTISIL